MKNDIFKFKRSDTNGWIVTDPSCNQLRKEIIKDQIYLFREDRVINPITKEIEIFESEMNYSDYTPNEIIDACQAFGYDIDEIRYWILNDQEIELMLECLFELET